MNRDWQIAERRPERPEAERLYVSLNRRGEIVLNDAAYDAIDRTFNVTLLYNARARHIGVKRPVRSDVHYFPVRGYGRGRRSHIVRAARMLAQFGIRIEQTVIFQNVEIDYYKHEPMLVLRMDAVRAAILPRQLK
ncbi:MAG: hypothetical protein WKF34_11430 [Pyrinomonadaceae bacterium]